MEEQKTNATQCKYDGFKAAMATELIVGFLFGTGVILAVKMVDSLEYCLEGLISRKC